MKLSSTDYRNGALCRLEDANRLLDTERWVAAVYLAGRAVESMLRSLLWSHGQQQEVGHDLKDLLKRVGNLGMLQDNERDVLLDGVQTVAILWQNNLRFADDDVFARLLKTTGRARRLADGRPVLGGPSKANAHMIVESCEAIISRGEIVWHRSRKK